MMHSSSPVGPQQVGVGTLALKKQNGKKGSPPGRLFLKSGLLTLHPLHIPDSPPAADICLIIMPVVRVDGGALSSR